MNLHQPLFNYRRDIPRQAPVELLIELSRSARLRITSTTQIELAAQILYRLR